ncbi:MAG: asparagine synthase (glutamine-hydrolyzing) [Bacteroidetes bacterium]|nr:asparagine synthase (glutamine-hydrolyzing) [Bacteroidota bacterium]MBK8659530.1 asparagine synthase (glutamine-hydrolyzing) [Bacteroidota bacterium]
MCGIAGQLKFKGVVEERKIVAMTDAIKHRGPDGDGVYINADSTLGLGHRRLSFLDLSTAGKQPMTNENGTIWITYNGEIYNYVELRTELVKLGHVFHSHTDTEVIIHGYEQWGSGVLNRLKGMFAFAIWDETKRELFLARDRFGIKPLYYYFENGNFIFSSEIKGIKANSDVKTTLDHTSFADYFVYRYVPSPKSIWKEVKKLPPAHSLIIKSDGSVTTNEYWKIPFAENVISDRDAVEQFDVLLLNSVKTHARSDVPVGSFLSGGYDSSAIVYYMSRFGYTPATFSIGFEGWDVSEHIYADMVARQYNTEHHSLILEAQSLDILEHLVWVYDEPNGDISIIPTYLVSKAASEKRKAVMSGEGSDEFLVGYQWQKDYMPGQVSWFQQFLSRLKGKKNSQMLDYYAGCMAMGRFDSNELRKLLHPDLHIHISGDPEWWYKKLYNPSLPDLKAMQVLDVKHFMGEQVLAKVDRASMANSLEVRVPFLDHEICEFVFSLSSSVYYKKEDTKHLLYQNIKNHFPDEILHRKKQGFVGPDKYYMNYDWYKKHLTQSRLADDKIINRNYIDFLLKENDHWRLWKIAVMELWYRKWV